MSDDGNAAQHHAASTVTVTPAIEDDRSILTILFQFYYYEFTAFKTWDVEDDGWFENHGLDGCWSTDERHPFLFRVDGKLAGFAIVDRRTSLDGERDVWDMADFFVLRRYQHQGIGERAARALLDRFRMRWEIRVMRGNLGALAFWRRVVDRATGGQFEETSWDDARWHGPVLSFSSEPDPSDLPPA